MRIEEIQDWERLSELARPWQELADRCEQDYPYVTPGFLLPWMDLVRRDYACRVLAVWDQDRLVGFAPFVARARSFGGVRFTVLSYPLCGMSPPFDILVSERPAEVMRALTDHLRGRQDWHLVELVNTHDQSPTRDLLRDVVRGTSLRVRSAPHIQTYLVPITTSWTQFHASRSKKFRQNLRRGLAACESLGPTRFVRYPGDGISRDEALRMTAHVIARSWKSHEDAPHDWDAFFTRVIDRLEASAMLSLRFLVVADQPIAYLLEIPYKGNIHTFHNAYDLSYQETNAGQLLLAEGLRSAHDDQCGRYDFFGVRSYLRQWTDVTRTFETVWLVNGTPTSRLKTKVYWSIHERRRREAGQATEQKKNEHKDEARHVTPPVVTASEPEVEAGGSIRLEEVTSLRALEALQEPWRELSRRPAEPSPYLGPEFMLPWLRRIGDRYRYRVLTAWDGEKLIGLAPLFERSYGRMGVRFRILSFPVSGPSPPFDFLVPERREAVIKAFAAHWIGTGDWDLLEMQNVPAASSTGRLLRAAVERTPARFSSEPGMQTTFVPIEPPWEKYLGTRSKNLRRNLRRAAERCALRGETVFRKYPDDGLSFAQAEEMACHVLERSWKHHDDPTGSWNGFVRDLMREADSGGILGIRFLQIGGVPVAYLMEVKLGGVLHGLHNAYDLDYQKENLGQFLLSHALQEAHGSGIVRYDFQGTKDYLLEWTNSFTAHDRIRLVNTALRSRALTAVYGWKHERTDRRSRARTEAAKNERKASRRESAQVGTP